MSGLDWFPTFLAAAGDPNIVDELKKGTTLGKTKYKVHLDGYNQLDFITGKARIEAQRDLLLRRSDAGRGPHRRLQVSLHRSAERLAGRHGQGRLADPDATCAWIRSSARAWPDRSRYIDWFKYQFWRFVFVQQEVAKFAETFIDFPPLQKPASFNLEAVKEQVKRAMLAHHGQ